MRTVLDDKTENDFYTIAIGNEEADVIKFNDRKDVLDTAQGIKRDKNYATGHVKVIRYLNEKRIVIPI